MLPLSDIIHLGITGIAQGCAYGLIALGFVLIYKATEVVNFAHGEFMMLGAFAVLAFSEALGWGFWPAFVLGCLSIAVVGYLVDAQIMRRIIGESQASVFILTVAFGFIFRALAGMIFGWNTRSLDTPFDGKLAVGNLVEISYDRLSIIVATVIFVAAIYLFFSRTRFGVAMQAASQNQLAAYYVGIPVKRIYSLVWALSAAIAACAGILTAPVSLIDPLMGFVGIKAFAAAIVGGFGSLPGAILGGLLVGVVEQFAGLYLPPGFSDMSAYVLLLVMLMVRPEGLFATIQRKKV